MKLPSTTTSKNLTKQLHSESTQCVEALCTKIQHLHNAYFDVTSIKQVRCQTTSCRDQPIREHHWCRSAILDGTLQPRIFAGP